MSLPLPPSMIGPFIPTSSTTSSSPPQSSSSPSSSSPSSSSSRTQSSQNYSPSNPLPSSSSLQQPAQLNIQRFNQNSTTTTLNLPTVTTASRNIPSTLKRHQLVFKLNQIQNLSQSPSLQSDLTTPISELATDLKNRSFNSPHNNTNQQQPRMKKLTEKRRNQTSSSSSSSSSSTAAAMNNNPFFDNIRQLNERLSLDVSLKNLSPIELWELENPKEYLYLLPDFLSDLILKDPIDRARLLAHQFYDLEIAEQRRLQDVMRWHCSQKTHISSSSSSSSNNTSNIVSNDSTALNRTSNKSIFKNFSSSGSSKLRDHQKLDRKPNLDGGVLGGIENHPFSISAGVELGYKNRYRNIWPWEHTRIRLPEKQSKASGTDYINASMITFRDEGGPRMSEEDRKDLRKGYIATQGPLGSTFDDFWSMVKEEDVGVIVMLTRRHEAGREKCGDYVKNGTYGDLVIRIESDRSSLGNSTHLNTGASDATLGRTFNENHL
ncbi:hypothetical protein BY996DRAFT_3628559 [Phakopsora pachyrhizi]|nr:hypothetical protein BY996DRAFT_3628559 [Phakopsora pachyrhizi]